MPTIDELVGDVMHLPLPRRAPRLRSLLQHYVRHTLLYNYMASPDAVEEALHLWNAVESPDRPRDSGDEGPSTLQATPATIPVDADPPNVVVSSAPVPPSPPPRTAPRVNGLATAASRPLTNGHAQGTIAARRGMPPLRLFSRDAGDTVVEPALQAPPPPPLSSPPVSPTLYRTWINVPHGPSAPPSPDLAHVVVRPRGSPSSGTQSGGRVDGEVRDRASPSGERRVAPNS
jgi:hypothetical protein